MFGAAKVTQFQHSRLGIQQQVLRFNVAMTNAQRVDVRQTAEKLVHVQLKREEARFMSGSGADGRVVLTRMKLIGIVCLFLAYWRATL